MLGLCEDQFRGTFLGETPCPVPNGTNSRRYLFGDQGLLKLATWFVHEIVLFGSSLTGAWLATTWAVGNNDQVSGGRVERGMAESSLGVDEAGPIHRHPLAFCRTQHYAAHQVVNDGEHGQLLVNSVDRLGAQHVHAERLFEVPQVRLDLPAIQIEFGQFGGRVALCIQQRRQEGHLANPKPRLTDALAQLP